MKIIRAIVDGERSPSRLAEHRDARCKASEETIAAALRGNYRDEHIFGLRLNLEIYDFHQEKIAQCDAAIEATLSTPSNAQP